MDQPTAVMVGGTCSLALSCRPLASHWARPRDGGVARLDTGGDGLDTTVLVAIAGIVGTLFAPVMGEVVRRKSPRKERLLELRLAAYAELLSVGARFRDLDVEIGRLPLPLPYSPTEYSSYRRNEGAKHVESVQVQRVGAHAT